MYLFSLQFLVAPALLDTRCKRPQPPRRFSTITTDIIKDIKSSPDACATTSLNEKTDPPLIEKLRDTAVLQLQDARILLSTLGFLQATVCVPTGVDSTPQVCVMCEGDSLSVIFSFFGRMTQRVE